MSTFSSWARALYCLGSRSPDGAPRLKRWAAPWPRATNAPGVSSMRLPPRYGVCQAFCVGVAPTSDSAHAGALGRMAWSRTRGLSCAARTRPARRTTSCSSSTSRALVMCCPCAVLLCGRAAPRTSQPACADRPAASDRTRRCAQGAPRAMGAQICSDLEPQRQDPRRTEECTEAEEVAHDYW